MPDITLRRCTPGDAALIADLSRRTFYDTFTGTCTEEDMQWFLDHYFNVPRKEAELADAGQQTWLAEADGFAAGFMRCGAPEAELQEARPVHALELKTLYVDQPFHGKGVAQALMGQFEAAAEAAGAGLLWLGVWEHNYRAQAFYRKYGFSPSGLMHDFPIGGTPQTDQWWWKDRVPAAGAPEEPA